MLMSFQYKLLYDMWVKLLFFWNELDTMLKYCFDFMLLRLAMDIKKKVHKYRYQFKKIYIFQLVNDLYPQIES